MIATLAVQALQMLLVLATAERSVHEPADLALIREEAERAHRRE